MRKKNVIVSLGSAWWLGECFTEMNGLASRLGSSFPPFLLNSTPIYPIFLFFHYYTQQKIRYKKSSIFKNQTLLKTKKLASWIKEIFLGIIITCEDLFFELIKFVSSAKGLREYKLELEARAKMKCANVADGWCGAGRQLGADVDVDADGRNGNGNVESKSSAICINLDQWHMAAANGERGEWELLVEASGSGHLETQTQTQLDPWLKQFCKHFQLAFN